MKRQKLHELMFYFETEAIEVAARELKDALKEAEVDWGKGYRKEKWHKEMRGMLKELRSIVKGRKEMFRIMREDA